jgi:hypothetical protein
MACDASPGRFGRLGLCAVISLIATALMTDYPGTDISQEYQFR